MLNDKTYFQQAALGGEGRAKCCHASSVHCVNSY